MIWMGPHGNALQGEGEEQKIVYQHDEGNMNFDEHYSSFMDYMLTLFVLPQKLNLVILVDKLSIRVKSHLMKFIK